MALLHIEREILEVAATAVDGPKLPAPQEIEHAVSALILQGLLSASDDIVSITPAGRAALT